MKICIGAVILKWENWKTQIQHFPKKNLLDEVQLCYVLSIYLITLFLDSKTINYIMFVK